MNIPKIWFIEGIPGSGKTTTARWLSTILMQYGQLTELYLEGNLNHPVDLTYTAVLHDAQWHMLAQRFPEQLPLLQTFVQSDASGHRLIPYGLISHIHHDFPETCMAFLSQHDANYLSPEQYCRIMLERWQSFSKHALHSRTIYIFEGCLLHHPISFLLARHNQSTTQIKDYILAMTQIMQPHQPNLIYFHQEDPRTVLQQARSERSDSWWNQFVHQCTRQAYGQAHKLAEEQGVYDYLKAQRSLEIELISNWSIPTISINYATYTPTMQQMFQQQIEQTLRFTLLP
ncbi:hypothetical protein [Marinicrinis sediminis]|uniref:Deoxynucleoside kinase domain-containing protein n=1 Tax=Marinicrinis sediminis TaxID=1652465 RepID=A0ABW5RCY0_9BACL